MRFKISLILSFFCYQIAAGLIVNLTRDNFEQLVESSPDPWLVNFCTYRHNHRECQNVLSEFLESSKILEGYLKLGFVDAEEQIILPYSLGVTNVPKILLFGYDKSHPKDFDGFKTVRGFTTAALKLIEEDINEQIKSRFVKVRAVQELDEYSLKKLLSSNGDGGNGWCVVNYSSNCHDCLKFSDIFKRLSEFFKHSFNFASIDVLKHSHHLEKYPQVRRYISEHSVDDYSGELTFDNLKRWLMNLLSDPLVNQLTSKKVLEKTCVDHKYCALVSMPILEDFNATYRANLLEDLHQRALASKHLSLGWLWFETGEQMYVERMVNVTAEDSLPVFTVVHVKKLIYLQMRQYNKDNSCDILDKMLGHVTDDSEFKGFIEASEFPKIFKVTPWKHNSQLGKVKSEL